MPTSDAILNQRFNAGDTSQFAGDATGIGDVSSAAYTASQVGTDSDIQAQWNEKLTQRNQQYEQATGHKLPVYYASPELIDGDKAQPSNFMKFLNGDNEAPANISKMPSQAALEQQLAQEKLIDQYNENQTDPSKKLPTVSDINKQVLQRIQGKQQNLQNVESNLTPGFWSKTVPEIAGEFAGGSAQMASVISHPLFALTSGITEGIGGAAVAASSLEGAPLLAAGLGVTAAAGFVGSLADSYSQRQLQEKTGIPFSDTEALGKAAQMAGAAVGGKLVGMGLGLSAKAIRNVPVVKNLFSPSETPALANDASTKLMDIAKQNTPTGELARNIIANPDNANALSSQASMEALHGLLTQTMPDNANTTMRATEHGFNTEANVEAARPEDMPWNEHVQNYELVKNQIDSGARTLEAPLNVLSPDGNLIYPSDRLLDYKNGESGFTDEEREQNQEGQLAGYATKNMDLPTMARSIEPEGFQEYDRARKEHAAALQALNEETQKRDAAFEGNEPYKNEIAQAQSRINEILGKVKGVESKLTKNKAAELAELRTLIPKMQEEQRAAMDIDTPEMQAAKERISAAAQRIRDVSPKIKAANMEAQTRLGGETLPPEESVTMRPKENPDLIEPQNPPEPENVSEHPTRGIVDDVTAQMVDAGRSEEEGRAAGQIIAAFFDRMSERYGGTRGDAADWYNREGAKIVQDYTRSKNKNGSYNYGEGTVGKLIKLFKGNANASTIIHESAHMFLHVMDSYANMPDAPQGLKDDMAAMRKYIGVSDTANLGERNDNGKLKYARAHEKFADAFERYVHEGIAPNSQLRGIFEQFKQWIGRIRDSVANTTLTPEVRQAFHNMLAPNSEPTVIAEEAQTPGEIGADIHEHESNTSTPQTAPWAADRIAKEIEINAQQSPEVLSAIQQAESAVRAESVPGQIAGDQGFAGQGQHLAETTTAGQSGKVSTSRAGPEATGSSKPAAKPTGSGDTGNAANAPKPPTVVELVHNIKINNWRTSEQIKDGMRSLKPDLEKLYTGPVSDDQRRALAKEAAENLGLTPETFDFRQPPGISNSVWAEMVKEVTKQSLDQMQEATIKYNQTRSVEDLAKALEAKDRATMIANYFSRDATAESGRTQRVFMAEDLDFVKGATQALNKMKDASGFDDLNQLQEQISAMSKMSRKELARQAFLDSFQGKAQANAEQSVLARGMRDNRPGAAIGDKVEHIVVLADQNAQEMHAMMPKTAYRSGGGILLRNPTDIANFIKEWVGQDSGDSDIKGFVSEYKKTIKATVEKMKRWGGNQLDLPIDNALSTHEDAAAMAKDGFDKWYKNVTDENSPMKFDLDSLGDRLNIDFNNEDNKRTFLKSWFDSAVRNGIGDTTEQGIDKNMRPFQLAFDDPANGWTAYNQQYGLSRGNPVREMNMTMRGLAHNSAILQELGPQPRRTLKYMEKVATDFSARADDAHPENIGRKETYTAQTQRDIANSKDKVKTLMGASRPPGSALDQLVAKGYGTLRNVVMGAKIVPGSFISQLFGDRFQREMLVRSMHGMPEMGVITDIPKYAQQFAGNVVSPKSTHAFANQLGFAGASWLDNMAPRPVKDLYDISGLFPKAIADITGAGNQFTTMPIIMQTEVAQFHANLADRTFEQLPPTVQKSFEIAGIKPNDWEDYRKTPVTQVQNSAFTGDMLLPKSLDERTDLTPNRIDELKAKFGTYVLRAGQDTIPFSNAQALSDFTRGVDPTSIGGMLLRDKTMGAHFLISNLNLLQRAISMKDSLYGKSAVLGRYALGAILATTLILQAKSLLKTGDTRDMNMATPQGRMFWGDVFQKGSGLDTIGNITGDGHNQTGVAGIITGPAKFGKQSLQYLAGEQDNAPDIGLGAFNAARWAVPDIWYAKPIIENGILDSIQREIDPDAYEKWQKSDEWAEDNWGTQNKYGHGWIGQ